VIVAWPASNDVPFEGARALDLAGFDASPTSTLIRAALRAEVIRIDQPRHRDPTMAGPPSPGEGGVCSGHQESTTMEEPIQFSTAFCMWLHVGGPPL
jgi:crotonobetainyl-CoA:carnitine CoA-transferase CaiB-like acyl-CoA transferase